MIGEGNKSRPCDLGSFLLAGAPGMTAVATRLGSGAFSFGAPELPDLVAVSFFKIWEPRDAAAILSSEVRG